MACRVFRLKLVAKNHINTKGYLFPANMQELRLKEEKEKKLGVLLQFAGIAKGDTDNKNIQTLKADKAKKYK